MSSKLNVYGFGVQLKSQIDTGNQGGTNFAVIAATPEQARIDLVGYVADQGDEVLRVSGPTIIVADAIYAAGEESASVPPVCMTVPAVTGVGAVDEVLSCTMGTWSGEPTSYDYQWKGDGATDLGSGPDYTVLASDAGTSITCVVTATNAAGSAEAPPSNAVDVPPAATRSHHRK